MGQELARRMYGNQCVSVAWRDRLTLSAHHGDMMATHHSNSREATSAAASLTQKSTEAPKEHRQAMEARASPLTLRTVRIPWENPHQNRVRGEAGDGTQGAD